MPMILNNNLPLFKGMFVLNPDTYKVCKIDSIGEIYIKVDTSPLSYGKSLIYPVIITSLRLNSFGFSSFKDDEKKVLYHEPKPENPDHDFYGEYDLREEYLLLSTAGRTIELDRVKYMHQIQLALINLGFTNLALKTEIQTTGKINTL